jgi:hypothetical protein
MKIKDESGGSNIPNMTGRNITDYVKEMAKSGAFKEQAEFAANQAKSIEQESTEDDTIEHVKMIPEEFSGVKIPQENQVPVTPVKKEIPEKAEEPKIIANPIKEKLKDTTSVSSIPTSMPLNRSTNASYPSSEGWQRVDLPSLNIPYKHLGVTEVFLKPFDMLTLESIYVAVEGSNTVGYIDALNNCISMDIRELTIPDFMFVQYWIRLASYPISPLPYTWTSRYGNENTTKIKQSDLNIKWLSMPHEKYQEWLDRDISFPTVGSSEVTAEEELPANMRFRQQYAQYVHLKEHELPEDSTTLLQAKMNKLINKPASFIEEIKTFVQEIEHGVEESIEVQDTKFEAKTAIAFLTKEAKDLQILAGRLVEDSDSDSSNLASALSINEQAEKMLKDAEEIRNSYNEETQTYSYKPKKETIVLRSISPMDMFPPEY